MKRKLQSNSDLPTKRRTYNCLKDDNDAWISFHQSSLRSLESSDYDAAIDGAIQALNLLDTLKVDVLDTCSVAYAMKGKFSKALEAAEKMIECTPLTAVGYLRAGETLALQGKHKRAIQVYTQGAGKVSREDEQYASLEENKAASEAQLDKRVDFLARLPVDLAHVVISQLGDIDYQMTCMDVSKTWRWVVADCASAWRRLSLSKYHLKSTVFRFIPLVGKHIHILSLDDAPADQTQKIIEAIFHGYLGNIQDLNVFNWCLGEDLLLMVVTRLGNSLTELKLRSIVSNQAPLFQSILLACPRLQTLVYRIVGNMGFNAGNTMVPLMSNLKSLSLKADSIPIPALIRTLRQCPHLQELHVEPCTGDVLKFITNHCSSLRSLSLNGDTPNSNQVVEGLSGIQQLTIYNTELLGPPQVIQVLNQNQPSLRQVWLSLRDQGPNVFERWSGLRDIEGKNLRSLTYADGSSMEMHTAVAAMMRNCRALQTVTFCHLNRITSNALDDAILRLPNLSSLSLFYVKNVNLPSFEHFLGAHASKGRSSSLRQVALYGCNNLTDTILERLATIETLQDIQINNCKGLTSDGLVMFGSLLSVHKALRNLHLHDVSVTDPVLYSLIGTSSLRRLSLVRLTYITGGTIENVVEEVESLEIVAILACPQIDQNCVDRIRRKLAERRPKSIRSMK